MNQGNPFKLKALVDKWPDFNTVVVRPQEQVSCLVWNEYYSAFIFSACVTQFWKYDRLQGRKK
jgi:hypothetical protein